MCLYKVDVMYLYMDISVAVFLKLTSSMTPVLDSSKVGDDYKQTETNAIALLLLIDQ